MPQVSVLLPVRDAAPWLASSLASLARQTVRDHEVIAVDDGSRDGSGELLDAAARRDARIVVHHTPPLGLPAALNLALSHARAPWVARHDADDVSHRERLARQLRWLGENPNIEVLGTRVRLFPSVATGMGMRRWAAWHNALCGHEAMRRELLIDSPLAHGTVLLRRSTLERVGGWHERGWAEDLDLWIRLYKSGARFAKLPQVLYSWRQHARSSTRTDPRYSRDAFMALKVSALASGLLTAGHRATLVGVGASLARWRHALGGYASQWHELRHPPEHLDLSFQAPVVLAYLAPRARQRWRDHLAARGMREMQDFIFVA